MRWRDAATAGASKPRWFAALQRQRRRQRQLCSASTHLAAVAGGVKLAAIGEGAGVVHRPAGWWEEGGRGRRWGALRCRRSHRCYRRARRHRHQLHLPRHSHFVALLGAGAAALHCNLLLEGLRADRGDELTPSRLLALDQQRSGGGRQQAAAGLHSSGGCRPGGKRHGACHRQQGTHHGDCWRSGLRAIDRRVWVARQGETAAVDIHVLHRPRRTPHSLTWPLQHTPAY